MIFGLYSHDLWVSWRVFQGRKKGVWCWIFVCWSQFWFCHCSACPVTSKCILNIAVEGELGSDPQSMRCPVQSWAGSWCRGANTQHFTAIVHHTMHWLFNEINAQTRLAHPPVLTSVPNSLSKNNPTDEFAFAQGRNNPDCLPSTVFICTTGTLFSSTVKVLIGQGQPTWQIF